MFLMSLEVFYILGLCKSAGMYFASRKWRSDGKGLDVNIETQGDWGKAALVHLLLWLLLLVCLSGVCWFLPLGRAPFLVLFTCCCFHLTDPMATLGHLRRLQRLWKVGRDKDGQYVFLQVILGNFEQWVDNLGCSVSKEGITYRKPRQWEVMRLPPNHITIKYQNQEPWPRSPRWAKFTVLCWLLRKWVAEWLESRCGWEAWPLQFCGWLPGQWWYSYS